MAGPFPVSAADHCCFCRGTFGCHRAGRDTIAGTNAAIYIEILCHCAEYFLTTSLVAGSVYTYADQIFSRIGGIRG